MTSYAFGPTVSISALTTLRRSLSVLTTSTSSPGRSVVSTTTLLFPPFTFSTVTRVGTYAGFLAPSGASSASWSPGMSMCWPSTRKSAASGW